MANKSLFATIRGALLPKTDTVNAHGAPAYALSPKHGLAQYASTGCFNHTFYADAGEQLTCVIGLCDSVSPEFVAKVAVHTRRSAYMKDMPALLCAWLSKRAPRLHEAVFAKVIDSARMLRTYVQVMRSGVVGRKSLGSAPKRLVREWLAAQDEEALFRSSVGQNPSLCDILKMVHPRAATKQREAFYGYMLGKKQDSGELPALVTHYERFKSGEELETPDLPFTMLSALPLSRLNWCEIAANASWQTTRMNLNTFARHGVFESPSLVTTVAARLRDPEAISKARVFPYQIMAAYLNGEELPKAIRAALHDALEIATANVPCVTGDIFVCPDVSGSMKSPVTGHRRGSTSKVRCVDVAALITASLVRKNPRAVVLPFEDRLVNVDLDPADSVLTNAEKLAAVGGGGTNCSAPLHRLNRQKAKGDLVVFVSDNQSWVDQGRGRGTELMAEWEAFRDRNPKARLVCLDIQPYADTQAIERQDILNVGGFSDRVFELIAAFAFGSLDANHWIGQIEAIEL